MTPLALLRMARAKLTPATWTQAAYARTRDGTRCASTDQDAVAWCGVGVLNSGDTYVPQAVAYAVLVGLIHAASALYATEDLADVNDTRGYNAVMACYDQAIAQAEREDTTP